LSTQLEELKVPALSLFHVTVPEGVMAVPREVSVTVAVQVVGLFTGTVLGLQLTLVVAERWVTCIMVELELPE
jgi:hypothetical protein